MSKINVGESAARTTFGEFRLDRPLFSSRYGFHDHQAEPEHWRARHAKNRYTRQSCESDLHLRCACPGSGDHPACCQRATQEDRMCDECREFCVAIDSAKVYHHLIDLYGAAR